MANEPDIDDVATLTDEIQHLVEGYDPLTQMAALTYVAAHALAQCSAPDDPDEAAAMHERMVLANADALRMGIKEILEMRRLADTGSEHIQDPPKP